MPGQDTRDDLAELYDPEALRRLGHALVDQLADRLAAAQRGEGPVLPWRAPAEQAASFAGPPPEHPDAPEAGVPGAVARYLDGTISVHHPRYIGHQVSVAPPVAALADLVSAVTGNEACIYELGPAGTAIELAVTRWCLEQADFPA